MIKVLANDGLDFNCKKQLEDLGVDVLDFHYDNESLKKEIKNFDVIIVRSATEVRKDIIDKAVGGKKLKLIIRGGVGIDNIDVDYARLKGIEV